MIEKRKWFKVSRDRGLNTFKISHINFDDEENFKEINLITFIRNEEDLIAS